MTLPPPQTFEDGQRKLYGALMACAGVAYGLAALCGGAIVVWGDWPADLARLRLLIVAGALGGAIVGSIAVTLALAVGGPVGRFKVAATKDGATIEAESDASANRPTVTTTTTVKPADPAPRLPGA